MSNQLPGIARLGRQLASADRSGDETGAESRPNDGENRFKLVPFCDVKFARGPVPVVRDLIPSDSLIVVWGPPKCGKSFVIADLALHVALGWNYRGRAVTTGPVVYVAAEGASGLNARIQAFRQEHASSLRSKMPPFYLVRARLNLVGDVSELSASIMAITNSCALIVIDTLNRTLVGSESSDADMAAYIKAADALREMFTCAVVVIHHCGHDASRPRGHSSLTGAVDSQIAVTRNDDNVTMKVEYMKDGPEGAELFSKLKPVTIKDDTGAEFKTCVVVPAEAPAPEPTSLPVSVNAVLSALLELARTNPAQTPSNADIPKGVTVVALHDWRERSIANLRTKADKRETKIRAFNRARARLKKAGRIKVYGEFVAPSFPNGDSGTSADGLL
jgi:hypothetical protein